MQLCSYAVMQLCSYAVWNAIRIKVLHRKTLLL